jgi:hypothetical protein
MADAPGFGGHVSGFGATLRRDDWWVGPVATAAGLLAWLLYYAWAAVQGEHYAVGPYLSPFYAPLLFADPSRAGAAEVAHAFLGAFPSWWPSFVPASPALAVGFLPGVFRITCYYYRKSYYRAFFGMPPGCAVGPRPQDYRGETALLLFQNAHRYTLYIAIALLPFLWFEALRGFVYQGQFGVGVGSLLLLLNAVLLTAYTFGCHAWRHLIGGRLDCFSCDGGARAQHQAWTWSSWLNARHMQFAWSSLVAIALCDIYVRLVSSGVIGDLNTWGGF